MRNVPGTAVRCGRGLSLVGLEGGPKSAVSTKIMMRLAIEAQRLCSELCLDGFHLAELVGRVFMEDMDHSVTARGEHQAVAGS